MPFGNVLLYNARGALERTTLYVSKWHLYGILLSFSIQLCSMCWHRIKNDEDNKCPNCREPYGDEPFKWGPLTPEQEVALKELRSKEQNSSKIPKMPFRTVDKK